MIAHRTVTALSVLLLSLGLTLAATAGCSGKKIAAEEDDTDDTIEETTPTASRTPVATPTATAVDGGKKKKDAGVVAMDAAADESDAESDEDANTVDANPVYIDAAALLQDAAIACKRDRECQTDYRCKRNVCVPKN